jgi:hypothetical protein
MIEGFRDVSNKRIIIEGVVLVDQVMMGVNTVVLHIIPINPVLHNSIIT